MQNTIYKYYEKNYFNFNSPTITINNKKFPFLDKNIKYLADIMMAILIVNGVKNTQNFTMTNKILNNLAYTSLYFPKNKDIVYTFVLKVIMENVYIKILLQIMINL